MKFSRALVAALAVLASTGAFAQVAGAVGGLNDSANFLTLSSTNVSGGAIYLDSQNFPNTAAIPENSAPLISTVGNWLAVGPSNTNNGGGSATLTLAEGTTYVSFLWGSPDPAGWNTLTVNTDHGSLTFTALGLGILPTPNGLQSFASYVNFTPTGAATEITSLVFSANTNAFEISNVTAVTPVPEPGTYALMLAGLAVIGFRVRRRST